MSAANEQSILRCGQCNKPFDKQSTLKRHRYYCRSRKTGSVIRSRACTACARGKTGCDRKRPKCSRCIAKAIECHYLASAPGIQGPSTRHSDDIPPEQQGGEPRSALSAAEFVGVEDNHPETSNGIDMDMIIDSALDLPDPDFANLEWDDAGIDFTGFSDPQETANSNLSLPELLSSSVRRSTSSTEEILHLKQGFYLQNSSIPMGPNRAVRSLTQRTTLQPGTQRITNLILHNLKSYPLMMLRHNNLPPFIHPSLISSDIENGDMKAVTNCISLVHMISSGARGSRKLFWENVRRELEHMYDKHLELNKWELLAAMQALFIYLLIRLDEGETDSNNLDFLVTKNVTVIAQRFARLDSPCHAQCALCNSGLESSWKEWIFRESRRRLAVVYRVFNMLVHFEPAAMCDMPRDLVLAPLPAKKQLWEAGDAWAWKAERQREPELRIALGLAASGDVVRLDESRLSCGDAWIPCRSLAPQSDTASWEEWCAGADGLGGLIMLAASLVV